MDFFIIWVLILCSNLAVWSILSRCYALRQVLGRLVLIKRPSALDDDDDDGPRLPRSVAAHVGHLVFGPAQSWLLSLYNEDDRNVTGFHPARMSRAAIALCVALQNVFATSVVPDGGVREAMGRSGQLACANLLPLALLAFPDLGITRLVSQPSPQITWAHALFGWIIWYEVLIHVGLSIFYLSGPQTAALLVGGSFAGVLLYATLLHAIRTQCIRLEAAPYAPAAPVCSHSSRRRQRIVHTSLASAFLLTLMVHVWPRPLHVAAVMATLVVQIAGMPVRIPPISQDQLTRRETARISVARRSERTSSIIAPFGGDSDIVQRTRAQVIKNLSPKYRILTLVACAAQSEGEDFFFKVNGTPVRVAWLERDRKGQYEAAVIVDERLTAQDGAESPAVHIEGPYTIPPSPGTAGPRDLDIVTMDSGILEAYSCLRWRSVTAGRNHQTHIIWFSQDADLVRIFVEQLRVVMRGMTVVWYGPLPLPDDTARALERNKHVTFHETSNPWGTYLPIYTRDNCKDRRVIDEKMMALVIAQIRTPLEIDEVRLMQKRSHRAVDSSRERLTAVHPREPIVNYYNARMVESQVGSISQYSDSESTM